MCFFLIVFIKAYALGTHLNCIALTYSKCPKVSNTLFYTFLAQILLFMQLFPNILSGMANSADPDKTAPSGAV